MTVILTHEELIELVKKHIQTRVSVSPDLLDIKFARRNQGIVDTSIEILSEPKQVSTIIPTQDAQSEPTTYDDQAEEEQSSEPDFIK